MGQTLQTVSQNRPFISVNFSQKFCYSGRKLTKTVRLGPRVASRARAQGLRQNGLAQMLEGLYSTTDNVLWGLLEDAHVLRTLLPILARLHKPQGNVHLQKTLSLRH